MNACACRIHRVIELHLVIVLKFTGKKRDIVLGYSSLWIVLTPLCRITFSGFSHNLYCVSLSLLSSRLYISSTATQCKPTKPVPRNGCWWCRTRRRHGSCPGNCSSIRGENGRPFEEGGGRRAVTFRLRVFQPLYLFLCRGCRHLGWTCVTNFLPW